MIRLILIGKGEISEQIAWCKRYSQSHDENERLNARIEANGNLDLIMNLTEPALDTQKIGAKLSAFKFKIPSTQDLEVFTGRIIKNIAIIARFEAVEKVPGRVDYEYGMGFYVETYNIFPESVVYKTVEVTQERKKMGLFKETYKVEERRPKTVSDLFGSSFKDPKYVLTITGKEKDNRDQLRFGLKVSCNINKAKEVFVATNLDKVFKEEGDFFNQFAECARAAQEVVNKIYTAVGYETAPEFDYFVGPVALDRKIKEFKSNDLGGTFLLEAIYE